uniref:Uncharacterized protein n=1 Tax=Trypanosoma congolense (strain IL3000) TaxID=1068625 RepID=G0UQS7_TRYCI|nr:hypothetical protein, unlikely [Trypanosoma congolense IL3000]
MPITTQSGKHAALGRSRPAFSFYWGALSQGYAILRTSLNRAPLLDRAMHTEVLMGLRYYKKRNDNNNVGRWTPFPKKTAQSCVTVQVHTFSCLCKSRLRQRTVLLVKK